MKEDKTTLVLSDTDRDIFLAALENPPEPNENLKNAFLEYCKQKS